MNWLHKRKPVEAICDPSTGELSMSRIASWFFVCLDIFWVVACIAQLPAKEAYAPVSALLAACTGSSFTAYGLNSFAGSRGRFSIGLGYETSNSRPTVGRAKPAPPVSED